MKRVLRITTEDATRDTELTAKLAVAEEWFRIRARGEFDDTAPATAQFWSIRYGTVVHLPIPGSTVTAVRAGSATDPSTLGSDSYSVMDDRRVRVGCELFTLGAIHSKDFNFHCAPTVYVSTKYL